MNRVRTVRDKRGISQADLAKSTGLSNGYVSRVERGIKHPGGKTMLVIAKALGSTVEELFGAAQETFEPAPRDFVGSELQPRVLSSAHDAMGSELLRASRKIELAFGGPANNVHVSRLRSDSLAALGYMPGDFVLVDYRDPGSAAAGDIVEAAVEHEPTGEWETVLRRLDPPFLMPASASQKHRAHTLGPHTQLRGIVIASWRIRAPEPELLEAEAADAG